ncbi:unnamed protein product [Symbiodinium natans]|uniref:Secreted protein n=1 Tax=Symbiodinium natans TaxID=878477 RepID=A0A812NMQ4_9DINO|nr:unnamed protein product [Symbiodinium natans]
MAVCKPFVIALLAYASRMVAGGPLSNLLADLTGQNSHHNATCLSDTHEGSAHVCGMASSFTAFFPDAASHQSDHFLPEISTQSVSGPHDSHHGDHMDQFDQQSLLTGKRPKMFVSFEKKE